jgi:hypothetical protein
MLKVGREGRGLRTQVPLQPLADGVADRSAGLAVDLFTVVVCSAIHEAALHLFLCDDHNKSRRPKLFRRFPVKIAKGGELLQRSNRQKARNRYRPGPFDV